MTFFLKDDVLTYRDVNQMKQLWASATEPDNHGNGEIWLDIQSDPPQLKRKINDNWQVIGSTYFIKNYADDSFSGALTSTKTTKAVFKFDNGHSMITVHDGYGNFNFKAGVDENHLITVNNGGSHIRLDEAGRIYFFVSTKTVGQIFTNDIYVSIQDTGITLYAAAGVYFSLMPTGIQIWGSTEIRNEMVIPLAQPAVIKDGSIWIS